MPKKTARKATGGLGHDDTCIGIAWAASADWSAAQSKVEEMKRKTMDLRKLTPEEIRGVVTAVCNADEDERNDVGRDAADRVASKVKGELSSLERVREDAKHLLDDVIADDNLKDKRDDAKKLKDEVDQRWTSIENMANNAMRGGNHPLISFLSLKGIEEHQRYQQSSSNCHAYEIETGRRADCLLRHRVEAEQQSRHCQGQQAGGRLRQGPQRRAGEGGQG